ncbi:potassium channel family protein [Leptospira noguchii]|uniref:Trk system potassium uptake protein TrkA, N-terminal domain protein n=4 Tax=Leptospira noguchii TaxID=28182 RepID=M6XXP8_9LEPT|nr:TrkA family potassium uptake protein [Leptospira noguchii]EMO29954.1 Trk system potassium uptake protein TrkA, N-terminal domain protein [Leptospira interrogans serovar Bataviae str. HAI135]EKR73922.1 Trk system potassium uptake protein TrkA, N-terminal domain protein [Leptospira noguchii str. 2006001870]EMI72420.1 Trk system potassium uptake protein TrkA, N-terminal domain protein [Leptospira noguchii str. Bonito]EMN02708.1 Trk system potassium uptake protein TrkA, N-terminal domain protein
MAIKRKNKTLKKRIAVIGLGEFGKALVAYLNENGHEVTAIDKDIKIIEEIKDFCALAVCVDTSNRTSLEELDLEDMDEIVVALAENFESLITTAYNLKAMNLKSLHIRYHSELNRKILQMIGIENLFNPEERAAASMAEQLSYQGVKKATLLSEEYSLFEVEISPLLYGTKLKELNLRENFQLNLVAIRRAELNGNESEGGVFLPDSKTVFREKEILILFGNSESIKRFISAYPIG